MVRVGLAQFGASADKAANLARALDVATEAARRRVDLLVHPEVYMVRRPDLYSGVAEPDAVPTPSRVESR